MPVVEPVSHTGHGQAQLAHWCAAAVPNCSSIVRPGGGLATRSWRAATVLHRKCVCFVLCANHVCAQQTKIAVRCAAVLLCHGLYTNSNLIYRVIIMIAGRARLHASQHLSELFGRSLQMGIASIEACLLHTAQQREQCIFSRSASGAARSCTAIAGATTQAISRLNFVWRR